MSKTTKSTAPPLRSGPRKILAVAAIIVLAGCGGAGHDPLTGGGGTVTSPTTVAAPAVPTVCLDVLNEADAQLQDLGTASQGLLDGFSASDGGSAAIQRFTEATTALEVAQQRLNADYATCGALPSVPAVCLNALDGARTQLQGLSTATGDLLDGFTASDGGTAAMQRDATAISALMPGRQKYLDDEAACRAAATP
jgi:hypothetical protein